MISLELWDWVECITIDGTGHLMASAHVFFNMFVGHALRLNTFYHRLVTWFSTRFVLPLSCCHDLFRASTTLSVILWVTTSSSSSSSLLCHCYRHFSYHFCTFSVFGKLFTTSSMDESTVTFRDRSVDNEIHPTYISWKHNLRYCHSNRMEETQSWICL